MLKNFLIIGAQRCGTRSLYQYIIAHPGVGRARKRELFFFNTLWKWGMEWYKKQFISKLGQIVGESTPQYLFDKIVPARVKSVKPQVKLLVLLRNPAMRAYSQYHHNRKPSRKTEPLTFRRALDAEESRLARATPRERWEWSYKARGRYAEQLRRWFARFPREQFHIIKSEDLFEDAESVMLGVFEFLGLDEFAQDEYKRFHNQNYKVYPPTYEHLMEYFEPYNQELYELLGRDFGWEDD